MQTYRAEPSASMLIESMRDIGYSLETALADVIDNAITAQSTIINIFAESSDEKRIGVLDNGTGMTREELMAAMKPGSRNPLQNPGPSDLGRFGLGLKTASFSQCRRLTVVTRRDGITSAAIWDLAYVAATDDWLVQIPSNTNTIPWATRLGTSGTLVLWEDLDRLVENSDSDGGTEHFNNRLVEASQHIELVFHRFLTGERGLSKVQIMLNNRPLKPFDPFHSNHIATVIESVDTIKVGQSKVTVQAFTLPHHRKVTPCEWERYAGQGGYLKNQGFYVYREKRLIIYGTWFGLARQAELTKLTRVRIDMPNNLDSEWKIDVKKASAQPPYQVRKRLRRIIDRLGATSKRVYTHKGKCLIKDKTLPLWNAVANKSQVAYQINLNHPVLADFITRLPEALLTDFKRFLELVASTLPLDHLFAAMGSSPHSVDGSTISDDALLYSLVTTVKRLRDKGATPEQITEILRAVEPYKANWKRTEQFLRRIDLGA